MLPLPSTATPSGCRSSGGSPPRRCAAREQLGRPVPETIEHADLALAIERGHEHVLTADGAHLRVRQRWPVEVPRLGGWGQARATDRNPVEGKEVLDLARSEAPSGPGEIEEAGVVDDERGRRGHAARLR